MTSKRLYEYTEVNDVEGERWTFYLYMTEPERQHLEVLIDGDSFSFRLEECDSKPKELRALVKHAEETYQGYAPRHQFAKLDRNFMTITDPEVLYKFSFLTPLSDNLFSVWKNSKEVSA